MRSECMQHRVRATHQQCNTKRNKPVVTQHANAYDSIHYKTNSTGMATAESDSNLGCSVGDQAALDLEIWRDGETRHRQRERERMT